MSDKVRAVRILEYIGDREWVEETLQRGSVVAEGIKFIGRRGETDNIIKSCLLDKFPSVLSDDECSKLNLISHDIRYAKDLLEQAKLILQNDNNGESIDSVKKIDEIIEDINIRTIPY